MSNATKWSYAGHFFGGETDKAGTPIGDLCTGYFVTSTDCPEAAAKAIAGKYADLAGRFELRGVKALPGSERDAARILRRGGTKDVPVLA